MGEPFCSSFPTADAGRAILSSTCQTGSMEKTQMLLTRAVAALLAADPDPGS
jgi:hypothetical protein